jgi:hypothetical protein
MLELIGAYQTLSVRSLKEGRKKTGQVLEVCGSVLQLFRSESEWLYGAEVRAHNAVVQEEEALFSDNVQDVLDALSHRSGGTTGQSLFYGLIRDGNDNLLALRHRLVLLPEAEKIIGADGAQCRRENRNVSGAGKGGWVEPGWKMEGGTLNKVVPGNRDEKNRARNNFGGTRIIFILAGMTCISRFHLPPLMDIL